MKLRSVETHPIMNLVESVDIRGSSEQALEYDETEDDGDMRHEPVQGVEEEEEHVGKLIDSEFREGVRP